MQQLTAQDAVFLSIETPDLPAHIGGLAFLSPTEDADFSFDHFVEFVRSRLGPVERFSWQLQEVPFGLDRPYWVAREDFDPADHLHSIRIPAPYSPEALSKLVSRIFERPMDRARPLWDMVLIEGLPGGRYVVLWRMHHCLMDGASGANLSEQLFDITPKAAEAANAPRPTSSTVADDATASKPLQDRDLYARAIRNAASLPVKQSKYVRSALKGLFEKKAPEEDSAEAALAPVAPWNGVVGGHRGLAWSSVSLEDVKRLKNTLGVTVNDVVLGITGGAVRGYLQEQDALPDASLVASVPCSMRTAGDTSLGNQIREMPISWATDIEDPIERIRTIHESAKTAKQQARDGASFDFIGMMSEAVLPGALSLFMRGAAMAGAKMPLPANAVVSNVPMTPFPLYCAGARIEQVVPISLLAPTQGLNITVLSYDGQLHFGLVHDPNLVPHAWDLAGRVAKSLIELQEAVDREIDADPSV